MKLIVQEGGERRAFRVSSGHLTIGSGEQADLRLVSAGVAALHAELVIGEGGARLRPRPEADAPSVGGVPARAEVPIEARQVVMIGEARLWLEQEQGAAAAASAPAAPSGPPGTPAVSAPRSSVVRTRTRTRRDTGLPAWVLMGLTVLVLALLYPFVSRLFTAAQKQGTSAVPARIEAARRNLREGSFDAAQTRLQALEAVPGLSDEERASVQRLAAEVEAAREEAERSYRDVAGFRFLSILEAYETKHLQGEPEPAKVRYFLKLARRFHEGWPGHPKEDWVRRQESRFAGLADLSRAPTWGDVEWELHQLVGGLPRNYAEAFAVLDVYREGVQGEDLAAADAYRSRMEVERLSYHRERIAEARREYDAGRTGRAVWWLVHGVIWSGEEALADEAARYLVRLEGVEAHLRGYRRDHPQKFELLLENERVRQAWERSRAEPDGD